MTAPAYHQLYAIDANGSTVGSSSRVCHGTPSARDLLAACPSAVKVDIYRNTTRARTVRAKRTS